jgi:phosphopentomutase
MMVNLVEFDSLYGHRRNPAGYKREIEDFDYQLGGFIELLTDEDLLLITADHGNDPTWKGTDHTREQVPLLGYYRGLTEAKPIGVRKSYADLGQTVLDNFGCVGEYGTSFLSLIK